MQSRRILFTFRRAFLATSLIFTAAAPDYSTDLTLKLAGNKPITRRVISYSCDGEGVKIGLPAGRFTVEYVSGSGNNLAVVPVQGISLVFSNVSSGSGARYMAMHYTWWESGRKVTVLLDTLAGKEQSTCRESPTD